MINPAIRDLLQSFRRHPGYQDAMRALEGGAQPVSLAGLTLTAKALAVVLIAQETRRPVLMVVDGAKQAEALQELTTAFFDLLVEARDVPPPHTLPALDVLPHQHLSPHSEILECRAVALWRMATQRVPLTIVPVAAALQRVEPPAFYRQLALTLRVNEDVPLEDLLLHLESVGYQKQEPVELVGEYSVRGGILDVFPAEAEQPVRIEFFGDTIESIRRFDPASQRSVLKVDETTVLPLVEFPRTRALLREIADCAEPDRVTAPGEPFPGWEFLVPLARPRSGTVLDMVDDAVLVWDEPEAITGAAERFWKRLEETDRPSPCPVDQGYLRHDELLSRVGSRPQVQLRELDLLAPGIGLSTASVSTRPSPAFHGNIRQIVDETRALASQGYRVALFATSVGEVERLADIFHEYGLPFQVGLPPGESASQYLQERAGLTGSSASVYLVRGNVRRGVTVPDEQLALIGSEDLFDTSDLVAGQGNRGKSAAAAFQADIADLKPGDFVVHATHGVGKFLGVKTIQQDGQANDFMLLEYAGDSKLYVPLNRLDLITKYRGGGEGAKPPVDRLGGVTWSKTKQRVKARMRDMADELLKLYAQRRLVQGFAFSPDSNWQREFEDAFDYAPTKDQLTAVADIKRDMESEQPMDRLLCGDVGFGKTEVAMRAAFKALGDGRQVAVLAPTTVLALQHYESFRRRFASFPVRIEMLSRFRAPKELKAAIEDIKAGKVDVVIGTHRLLSQDVEYADLGLLVVDEEQRFGVKHKERLKQIKRNVDVLTMSATPIPRTLHMSLLGLRDLSVIETPPKDRLAVHTVVAHLNDELVKTAIDQELSRNGQVYYVHNRVETIFQRASHLQSLVPGIRIGVGHGQMPEAELERVLLGFMRGEFDVFVCTTIVENGLDIPRANTILIENAERYGLSELYQLRGRVGRSNRRAYAYLLVPPDASLSEVARKRLAALKEFSDLGAGFKIAALDLELRGAGNLLGGEQSGQIAAVGFDTYVRLLEEAVHELRGEEVPLEVHSTLTLGLELRIPPEYIADEQQRLRAYKRIADATDPAAAERVLGELSDRYGPVPDVVRNLVQFAQVKNVAQQLGIEAVDRRSGFFNIKFHPEAKADPARLMAMIEANPGAQFTPAGVLKLPVPAGAVPAQVLESLHSALGEAVGQPA